MNDNNLGKCVEKRRLVNQGWSIYSPFLARFGTNTIEIMDPIGFIDGLNPNFGTTWIRYKEHPCLYTNVFLDMRKKLVSQKC